MAKETKIAVMKVGTGRENGEIKRGYITNSARSLAHLLQENGIVEIKAVGQPANANVMKILIATEKMRKEAGIDAPLRADSFMYKEEETEKGTISVSSMIVQ